MKKERLQKYLANLGYGSRRSIEKLITAGKISVNNKVAELGCIVDNNDIVHIENKKVDTNKNNLDLKYKNKILLYNKPLGEVCTKSDPEGRPIIFDNLPKLCNSRWINIGRLDINTSGLILFTTNGELANKLMHPSSNLDREYVCSISGDVSESKLNKLLRGVDIKDDSGRLAKFKKITQIKNNKKSNRSYSSNAQRFKTRDIHDSSHAEEPKYSWYNVVITEGRNREVRKLWAAIGCSVNKLKRIKFGNYTLPKNLEPGNFIILESSFIG